MALIRSADVGDIVSTSHATELADHTLSLLGHAIFTDARAIRDIIDQVESQRLNPPRHPPTGVREEQGVYHIARTGLESGAGRLSQLASLPGTSPRCVRIGVSGAAVLR